MSTKSKLSPTDILVALAFLGLVVFYCFQMLSRQTEMVSKVNQNIEITSVIHDMREILSGVGCSENLSGLNRISSMTSLTSLKRITSYIDGTSDSEVAYSTEEGEAEPWSETKLKLIGFELNPRFDGETLTSDKTYLVIHFERLEFKERFRKRIKIFTKETNGVITDCSIVPFAESDTLWEQEGNKLVLQGDKFSIGTESNSSSVNLMGGVFSTVSINGCSKDNLGNLNFDRNKRAWQLCTNRGWVTLKDDRRFD